MEEIKATQRTKDSAEHLFLQMVFAKKQYPKPIIEQLRPIADQLAQETPDAKLLAAIQKEFWKGGYQIGNDMHLYAELQETLMTNYGYDFYDSQVITDRLYQTELLTMPLIVLIGKSGTGKTSAALSLESQYHLKQVESYTTRPRRTEGEKGHSFITEEKFDAIPEETMMAYLEYRGYRYCATRDQLNVSNLYIVHPEGYETMKERYHDRPMFAIELATSTEIRRDRMRNRGSAEAEIEDRLKRDEEVFKTIQTDAVIDTGNLSVEEVGRKIFDLLIQAAANKPALSV